MCLYAIVAHSVEVIFPKKEWGCVVHFSGPPAVNLSVHSNSRCRSTSKLRSSLTIRLLSVGILRRIGFSFMTLDIATLPNIRPIKLRGEDLKPRAISVHAEQCASICAAVILPHCRSLSGLRSANRRRISLCASGSNKFFICFPSLAMVKQVELQYWIVQYCIRQNTRLCSTISQERLCPERRTS
jgi:hypothetical protein